MYIAMYRAAVWIGHYRLLPEIIGYFPYSCKKPMNFQVAKMYENNGTFYGGTKL